MNTTLGKRLPRRGPVRALLKRLYYSAFFRTLFFGPVDAFERLTGRRPEIVPPRRLRFIGHRGDFLAIGRARRKQLIEDVGLEEDDDILDIGCGVGRVAVALTEYLSDSAHYDGFDVVPSGIAWCQKTITPLFPNFRFRAVDVHSGQYNRRGGSQASRFRFPYEDDSFDVACAISVFTHMRPDDVGRYLEETARVLRPGGRLVASFFLVDDDVLRILADDGSDFALDHQLADASGQEFWASDPLVPEYNVGLHLEGVLADFDRVGLVPIEDGVRRGWWSGLIPPGGGADYQDVIIAQLGEA